MAQVREKTGCDIIGHFDLVSKFNEDGSLFDETHPRYRAAALAALERLMDTPAVFEMNTGAMAKGYRTRPYPAAFLRERLQARGKRLLFSSDCHDKTRLLYGAELYAAETEANT